MPKSSEIEEGIRLKEVGEDFVPKWHKWGPYVSERAWGTVREDYSADGNAWNYFPYDLSYSKAYRWGEDAIAGWCDRYQVLVLAPAFWNENDLMLKERLFGLTIFEGNHGEDVKELYFHLDATPTHSYLKYLYKYPQAPFPYEQLRLENSRRNRDQSEYELADTGVFNENRYFDIFIEYAKDSSEDLCIKIEAHNRGPEKAPLHILMQLWFRNQWSWTGEPLPKPQISPGPKGSETISLLAEEKEMPPLSNLSFEYRLGARYLYGPKGGQLLFTENETRMGENGGHYKDAFHHQIVRGQKSSNPTKSGSKACLHYRFKEVASGEKVTLLFRFSDKPLKDPLADVEAVVKRRQAEADRFYASVHPKEATEEEKLIQRQALAGLVWNKQIYLFDVDRWLQGDNPRHPPPPEHSLIRNVHWRHLNSMRILLMPDKWEYPWFAAWDQAFHCLAYSLIDREFAKDQLWLLLFDQFQHPNGQVPAYEWEFSDLNPPVQAWAAWHLYSQEKEATGKPDRTFLERCFHKLLINFAWWVNKIDSQGNNVFEGGFLGFDNIAVLDRSQKLPGGGVLQQSDGTGWMAMFSLNLMRMALELSKENKTYESLATKFFEHYVYIAHAMKKRGNKNVELWSEKDGFFYDVLSYPDGNFAKFRIRSLVGLIPLFAVEVLHEKEIAQFPEFYANFHWFLQNRRDLVAPCVIPTRKDDQVHYALTPMNSDQLQSVLRYVWDPNEFRAPFGLRSMSRFHEKNPFVFQDKHVGYEPSESLYAIKGGNSNWRGPVWMPITFLLVEALHKLTEAFGKEFAVELPNEKPIGLEAMAQDFAKRAISLFAKDQNGKRPALGNQFPFPDEEHLLFYEYYNPETGKGLGASHQTGWTALVANLIAQFTTKKLI